MGTPRKTTTSRRAPSTKSKLVAATVDPKMQQRYDALLAEIHTADRDEMRGFDRKYEAAGEIIDAKLFLLSLWGTVETWAPEVLKVNARTAQRYVRVARHCSPDDEQRYGTAKLDALLQYLDATTHGTKRSVKVALDKLRIPVTRGGKELRVSLDDVTVKELIAASKSETSGSKSSRRTPVEATYADALRGDKELASVTVRVTDGKASFGGVPLTAMDRFVKAVRAVDWRKAAGRKAAEDGKEPHK